MIYDGSDPATGKEKRSWHPAGTDRDAAERLARKLACDKRRRDKTARSLTFGAYLAYQHLLPGMGADAAARFERLVGSVLADDPDSEERRGNNRRNTA